MIIGVGFFISHWQFFNSSIKNLNSYKSQIPVEIRQFTLVST
ncbi:hypothetical protein AVDCRST_MAG84-5046 [uncultured Microcoleus sp.]|uniref:Uncharacterized protein n=1 Tax=uncultured Microcoleus sp. TaxID=259945 RepID=A0A6J4N7U1_9CYAN|nr:hypothetical protein AVDCRST_MAG84-5046 [uncultured Microcoleus sp.]